MTVAVLSVIGFFISLYLWLWKVGFLGSLACGDGGCETVQLSDYADFLGIPVPFWGMVGYVVMLAVSLGGLQPRWAERREPTLLLLLISGVGIGFTAYLTYLEAFVIHAWCRWCIVSAVIIVLIFMAALAGIRTARRPAEGS
ncbi:MAG: vitamin K epoxide reductase family protein [Gemmatimonadota bacterium]|nr:MAG: vitamin K epoxide reductase family protein [Gemmatimonadota bacterium]